MTGQRGEFQRHDNVVVGALEAAPKCMDRITLFTAEPCMRSRGKVTRLHHMP
jgi:hypothetical protein